MAVQPFLSVSSLGVFANGGAVRNYVGSKRGSTFSNITTLDWIAKY